jgi:5-hydroxyisourate hydrolase-like protein (transthyretin family)
MFIKSLQIGLLGLVLCATSAWAGGSSIQGIVKDAKGQPIKGADVRVESKDGKQLVNTVKTDATGRYVTSALPVGVYRVTLVVKGSVKSSIMNTQTRAGQPTQLNFDMKGASTSKASQTAATQTKGKHMVWVPNSTGSHIGGRWVEVDDNGSAANDLNVKRGSAEALRQQQMQNAGGPQSLGGSGGGR